MTCRFQKVPVVFNKSLVDLEKCTSFVKTKCDLLNSTCEIDLLKLLTRHRDKHVVVTLSLEINPLISRYYKYYQICMFYMNVI